MNKIITLSTCAALLAGCANIGTVNGVPVGDNARLSRQNQQTYCQANPAVCIIDGAIGIGVLKYLIDKSNDNDATGPVFT